MLNFEKDLYISRICSGYIRCKINNKLYKLFSPKLDILYEANEIYMETYNESLAAGVMDSETLFDWLIETDKWSKNQEIKLTETIPNYIENCKLEMLDNFNDKTALETMRKYLRRVEREYSDIYNIRHSYDSITCHGVASFAKTQFIIENCCEPYCNPTLILNYLNENIISETIIREIARTDPWRTIWACKKMNNIFTLLPSEYSDEQKRLISYSFIYDSVFESTDCPTNGIINDDDVLDGWLIKRRKKQETEQVKNEYEEKMSRHKDASDVFLVMKPEEISKASHLNNSTAKAIIDSRIKTIQAKGEASDIDFADIRTNIEMMKNSR